MKKIYSLNLYGFKNPDHFDFMDFVVAAITFYPYVGGSFPRFVARLRKAFDYENEVFKKFDRKALTAKRNEADTERDQKFRNLRDALKLLTNTSAPAGKATANELLGIISLYGDSKIPGMGNSAETGVLTNLVEDFETKYAAQVEQLGISKLVDELKAANEAFKQAEHDRVLADSEIGKAAMVNARADMDLSYRAFVSTVNNEYFLSSDNKLVPFMDYLNVRIDQARILLGQRPANPDWGSEEEEEAEDATPAPPSEDQPEENPSDKPSGEPENKPEDKPNEDNKPSEGGNTGNGSGTGDENTGGTPPEDDDPNMPPPGSGGSGFE